MEMVPFPIPSLPPTMKSCRCIKITYELKVEKKTITFASVLSFYAICIFWCIFILIIKKLMVNFDPAKGDGNKEYGTKSFPCATLID